MEVEEAEGKGSVWNSGILEYWNNGFDTGFELCVACYELKILIYITRNTQRISHIPAFHMNYIK